MSWYHAELSDSWMFWKVRMFLSQFLVANRVFEFTTCLFCEGNSWKLREYVPELASLKSDYFGSVWIVLNFNSFECLVTFFVLNRWIREITGRMWVRCLAACIFESFASSAFDFWLSPSSSPSSSLPGLLSHITNLWRLKPFLVFYSSNCLTIAKYRNSLDLFPLTNLWTLNVYLNCN